MFHHLFKGYKYENTRQYLRLPASWPIRCEVEPGNQPKIASTKDVSAGGVAMVVQQMIPVGSRLHIEISVPPINRSIAAKAQVIRCVPGRGGHFELGIRFLEINSKDQADLNGAIEKFYSPNERARQQKTWWRKIS